MKILAIRLENLASLAGSQELEPKSYSTRLRLRRCACGRQGPDRRRRGRRAGRRSATVCVPSLATLTWSITWRTSAASFPMRIQQLIDAEGENLRK